MKKLMFVLLGLVLFASCATTKKAVETQLPQSRKLEAEKLITTEVAQRQSFLPEPVKIIGMLPWSIVLNAVGDGLDDSGHKEWGHLCNAASIGLLVTSPFIIDYDKSKWGWYLASYMFLRVGAFDYTYNATRGLPLNYIGVVSTWDKALKKLNPPNTYLGRAVFFTGGVFIPINKLNGNHSRHR